MWWNLGHQISQVPLLAMLTSLSLKSLYIQEWPWVSDLLVPDRPYHCLLYVVLGMVSRTSWKLDNYSTNWITPVVFVLKVTMRSWKILCQALFRSSLEINMVICSNLVFCSDMCHFHCWVVIDLSLGLSQSIFL